MKLKLSRNDKYLIVNLENNRSVAALIKLIKEHNNSLTIEFDDYGGFEKIGDLPIFLPKDDVYQHVAIGDVLLYQGITISLIKGKNAWEYTKLGKIENIDKTIFDDVLGLGKQNITLSILDN